MALVGLVSDTHGRLDPAAYAALADCDFIIHAGDIGDPSILRELETLAPVCAVLGNNDFDEYGADVGRFARPVVDGVRFLVAHYPRDVRMSPLGSGAVVPGDPMPDVCVHGHTHVPAIVTGREASPARCIVCPGSASRPRGGSVRSVGKVEVAAGAVLSVRVEDLRGNVVLQV